MKKETIAMLVLCLFILVMGGAVWASDSFLQIEEIHKERKEAVTSASFQ